MRRNPVVRLQAAIEQAVRAASPGAQSLPLPGRVSALAAGSTVAATGEWVGFGRLELDPLTAFRLA